MGDPRAGQRGDRDNPIEAESGTAGRLGHDLSNILAVIRVNAQILRDPLRDRDHDDVLLERIGEMAADGCVLTARLLDSSAPVHVAPAPIDMGDLIVRLGRTLDGIAGRDIEVRVEMCPDRLVVRIDRARAEQLLLNLGRNAIDAIGGQGRIDLCARVVRVEVDNDEGLARTPHLELEVSDSGPGIPSALIDRIFEPYVTTKAPGGGRGLGLATAHETVTHAGGAIRAGNARDGGAVLAVLLPLIEPPAMWGS